MDLPPAPLADATATGDADSGPALATLNRRDSSSQQSESSQTAADFIRDQMQLEADAREALPYSIENCTKALGPLRQSVFACLTCNPPPANPTDPYQAAGVCYACSVQCHGEHNLVEIFGKRNFVCDCGTTRFPATSPCTLRLNSATISRGVHSEEPGPDNKYNQNFRNRFCACECDYDPFQQKGTMFQCLGLGTHETGGCGEDWYHPGCIVGLGPNWFEKVEGKKMDSKDMFSEAMLPTISEDSEAPRNDDSTLPFTLEVAEGAQSGDVPMVDEGENDDEDPPPPPGFPADDDFETFICYKCVDANPWIKRYAGQAGFLPPVFSQPKSVVEQSPPKQGIAESVTKKRKADDEETEKSRDSKRLKSEVEAATSPQQDVEASAAVKDEVKVEVKDEFKTGSKVACKLDAFPPATERQFSLFCTESFRDELCRCSKCFPSLKEHPQLLEEEEIYEPPVSEAGSENGGGSTNGSGSLLDRGESALRNVDRVRAIEGVMAYNSLKVKLKPFFQRFAESGEAIGADDIKEYFAKLRGDDQAIKEAGESAKSDQRKEQPGY